MPTAWIGALVFAIAPLTRTAAAGSNTPSAVDELWRDFDPRALPLGVEVIKETVADGIVLRTVRYVVEELDGQTARVLAHYGVPVGKGSRPAVLHIHGGGQIASVEHVKWLARRGYAALSVNWGGRPLPGVEQTGLPGWEPLPYNQNTTDQGNIYRTEPDARANSWYHWAIACRRGITFLEQQPEVDRTRIGVFGVSMGGRLTFLVAGMDRRIVCAASVYGATLMGEPFPGIVGSEFVPALLGNATWRTALDAHAYAPLIACPLLYLSSTNDFYGRLDHVDRTLEQTPPERTWRSLALHFTHHISHDVTPVLALWLDQWLKAGSGWPAPPKIELGLNTPDRVPVVRVVADRANEIKAVAFHYTTGPFPQSRFWRTIALERAQPPWSARLPLTELTHDVRVFANVTYESGLVLSTPLASASPVAFQRAGVVATDPPTLVIDDFSRGAIDWFVLEAGPDPLPGTRRFFDPVTEENSPRGIRWSEGGRGEWRFFTRKVGDPKWRGPSGAALKLQVKAERPNTITLLVVENYESQPLATRAFVAHARLTGGGQWETIALRPSDFRDVVDGRAPANWEAINLLGIVGRYKFNGARMKLPEQEIGMPWEGRPPALAKVEWSFAGP